MYFPIFNLFWIFRKLKCTIPIILLDNSTNDCWDTYAGGQISGPRSIFWSTRENRYIVNHKSPPQTPQMNQATKKRVNSLFLQLRTTQKLKHSIWFPNKYIIKVNLFQTISFLQKLCSKTERKSALWFG